MQESVSKKTAKTSFWTAIERFTNTGVNLLVQLILARLLMPSDFGVVAMMMVFIGISQAVSECGVTNALIRKQDCIQSDYSTGFYINFGISAFLYVILFFASPLIARFYEMPSIEWLLRVYALVFIFDALRIVQYSKLCKQLDFKTISIVSSSSVFISGVIGVGMAYAGFGAWALVAQLLSASLLYFVFIQFKEPWMPSACFDKDSFRYLWGFGSKMLLTGIISRIYSNIYNLVIGKNFAPSVLGVFNNGQKYALFYPNLVESIFVKNTLPIFSEYQDDNQRLLELYRKFIQLVSFLTFPVCVIVTVLAKPIVLVLFTEKWIDAVPYLQIFAITALLIPANSINLNMLQVKGRSDYTLKAEIIKKSIGFILVFALLPLGPIWLAAGGSVMNLIAYSVNVYYAKKLLHLSLIEQLRDVSGITIASAVAVVSIPLLGMVIASNILLIIAGFTFSMIIYAFLTVYVFKVPVVDQITHLIKNKLK